MGTWVLGSDTFRGPPRVVLLSADPPIVDWRWMRDTKNGVGGKQNVVFLGRCCGMQTSASSNGHCCSHGVPGLGVCVRACLAQGRAVHLRLFLYITNSRSWSSTISSSSSSSLTLPTRLM